MIHLVGMPHGQDSDQTPTSRPKLPVRTIHTVEEHLANPRSHESSHPEPCIRNIVSSSTLLPYFLSRLMNRSSKLDILVAPLDPSMADPCRGVHAAGNNRREGLLLILSNFRVLGAATYRKVVNGPHIWILIIVWWPMLYQHSLIRCRIVRGVISIY